MLFGDRLDGRGGGEVLLVDPNTVHAHFKRYGKRGLEGLRRVGDGVGGSVGLRKAKHLVELDAHLQANLYLSAKAVAYWVKGTFGVSYTESGMTAVLRRLGYVYKKHQLGTWQGRPGSANAIPRNVRPYPQSQGSG